jgi:phosphotriesterase-related protein
MRTSSSARVPQLTRREAITMLSASAVASLACDASAAQNAAAPVSFPKGAVIRTLLKDMAPGDLKTGAVLFHEHLSYKPRNQAAHFSDDVGLMIEEVRAAAADGISCIVDGGHEDMSRSLDALNRIARETGVPIVASGGYYMQRSYPTDIATRSADQIAEQLVRDAKTQRLGAFGEIGQQGGVMTADERKVFEAVAKAQVKTGLPIFTHNAYTGTRQTDNPVPKDTALKQIDVLEAAGATPRSLAIGHVCCLDDPKAEIAQQIARRGAFVGFDRVTIQQIIPDDRRVLTIMSMVEAGHADHVLISSDFYSPNSLKKQGGAGIGQAWTAFAPLLRKAGMQEATLRRIMFDNPRRFLSFVPK